MDARRYSVCFQIDREQEKWEESAGKFGEDLTIDKKSRESTGCYLPKRYIVTVLGFLGMFNTYAMRVNLSVAMVAMVNSNTDISHNNSLHQSDCPADIAAQDQKQNREFKGERYDWDTHMQGYVMSSFFYCYFITVLLGGYLAERFGATRVFGGGILLTAILTLLSPIVVKCGVVPFMVIRAIEGLGEGVTFPAITTIISRWSPKLERSRISAIIFSGATLGTMVTMPVCGWLCSIDFLGGWPAVFYVSGALSCVWYAAWLIFIYESPQSHPSITEIEMSYFEGAGQKIQKFKVPWWDIITSVPFWALMVANVGYLFGIIMFFTQLPTYISTVHHLDIYTVGVMLSLPYTANCIGIWTASYLADILRTSGRMKTTTIRKVFNSIAGYGACVCLLVITQSGCRTYLIIGILSLCLGLTGFLFSGFNVTHVDMSPDFAGTLYGLTNGVASIFAIVGPMMVSVFTSSGHTIQNWNKVFYIMTLVYFVSATVFARFASAEVQPWGRAARVNELRRLKIKSKSEEDSEH